MTEEFLSGPEETVFRIAERLVAWASIEDVPAKAGEGLPAGQGGAGVLGGDRVDGLQAGLVEKA